MCSSMVSEPGLTILLGCGLTLSAYFLLVLRANIAPLPPKLAASLAVQVNKADVLGTASALAPPPMACNILNGNCVLCCTYSEKTGRISSLLSVSSMVKSSRSFPTRPILTTSTNPFPCELLFLGDLQYSPLGSKLYLYPTPAVCLHVFPSSSSKTGGWDLCSSLPAFVLSWLFRLITGHWCCCPAVSLLLMKALPMMLMDSSQAPAVGCSAAST